MGNASAAKIIIRAEIPPWKYSDDRKDHSNWKTGSDVREIQEVLPLFMPITVS